MDRKTKGIHGEAMAQKYYIRMGYEILETNYRFRRAEVDFIALFEEELLVFVEVKNRSRLDYGQPETFVSKAQENRIKQAAEDYIMAINWKKDIRFDIICLDAQGNIEVFEDAF